MLHAAPLRDPLTHDSSPVDRSFEADSSPLPGSLLNSEVGPLPVVHTYSTFSPLHRLAVEVSLVGMLRPREACGARQGRQQGIHPGGRQEGESELSKGVRRAGREPSVENVRDMAERRKHLVAVAGMLSLWKMGEASGMAMAAY